MGESGSNRNREKDQPSVSPCRPDDPAAKVRNILVIEDSKPDVFLIREALKSGGVIANIHVVRDGYAATNFFDAVDADPAVPCPDVVLLDLNLPRKSGAEVLKHLRESGRCKAARVLIVTSSDSPLDRASIADLNAAGYFKKPTEYAEFMKLGPLVKALLDESKPAN